MELWHIPPRFTRDIPMLRPVHVHPHRLTVLVSDPAEQEARIQAIQTIKALAQQYGVEAVCTWLSYSAAELNQPMPCQGEDA